MPREITVLTLACEHREWEKLAEACDRTRSGTVSVSKDAVMHLLYDYSQLMGIIEQDFSWIDIKTEFGGNEAHVESLLALRKYRDIDIEIQELQKLMNVTVNIDNQSADTVKATQTKTEIEVEVIENDTETQA